MDTKTQTQLAKDFGVRQGFISDLKIHRRFTENYELALAMSKVYGEPPIEYIHPRKRPIYLKAYRKAGAI